MPTSRLNARAKLRTFIPAASASISTVWGCDGSATTRSCASRIGSRSASCAASGSENWAWLPLRCAYMTSQRATSSAASRPRSSSTSASARSIPAVTPAEVHTEPSRT